MTAYTNLFGETIDLPDTPSGPTKRKRKDPKPAGYAFTPGAGPQGETCGSCKHHVIRHLAKRYHKCALTRSTWTGGGKTDIRVRSKACKHWIAGEPEDDM